MTNADARVVAIVDDDEAVRNSLQFLLLAAGYITKTFASAGKFLNAEMQHWGCLILDHHMPHMTGLDLVEKLHDLGISIPTLLITGSPSPDIVARAAQLSVPRVLEKPPAAEELLAFVAGALRRAE